MASYWDRWKRDENEDPYIRWNAFGDSVEGVIVKQGSTDFGGKESSPVPVLHLRTRSGAEKILNVSQAALLRRLTELSPEVGDHLQVTYTGEAKGSGPSPAKLFDVVVTPKTMMGGEAEPPPPTEPPAPPATPPATEGPQADPWEPF